ncbi:wall-associated receptor kinase carboxy-terminal protein [Thalictrum thalictroides]|uniref:Wall-associated receptor kinase carboxy-terminal protein n=1 Tax=Thalictrum thalictroides TaxID=46969 RepID=A0A7J6VKU5_THATH|nr:wall-associated receptor kinase carboxy-terminal protein [Thalictrum thalictroides]
MQPSVASSVIFVLLILSILHVNSISSLSSCRSQCGATAIKYPFGIDDGCGAPHYRKMLNCSGDLFFQTPSGNYKVKSIDYDKETMVIYDPSMSTCTMLQPHHDFILSEIQSVVTPPTSDSIFVLLNCSIDSPILNHYSSLCFNFSGHSCDELYSACPSFRIFHLGYNATTAGYPPCCFTGYNTVKYMSMNILDCSHYTTVYNTDGLKGIGPLDWAYGIKMSYSVPNSGCERCQRSGGTCGYDTETEMMLCICSSFNNSTRDCGK